jgi:hypothetical protein
VVDVDFGMMLGHLSTRHLSGLAHLVKNVCGCEMSPVENMYMLESMRPALGLGTFFQTDQSSHCDCAVFQYYRDRITPREPCPKPSLKPFDSFDFRVRAAAAIVQRRAVSLELSLIFNLRTLSSTQPGREIGPYSRFSKNDTRDPRQAFVAHSSLPVSKGHWVV